MMACGTPWDCESCGRTCCLGGYLIELLCWQRLRRSSEEAGQQPRSLGRVWRRGRYLVREAAPQRRRQLVQ